MKLDTLPMDPIKNLILNQIKATESVLATLECALTDLEDALVDIKRNEDGPSDSDTAGDPSGASLAEQQAEWQRWK